MKTFNLNYNTKFYEVIIKIKCFDFSMEDILNYKLADVDLFSSLLNNNFIYLSDLPSNLNSLESTFNAIFIEKLIDELKLIVKNLKSVKMNILIYFIIKYSFPQGINCFSRTQMKNLYLELLFFFPSLDLDRKGLSKKLGVIQNLF